MNKRTKPIENSIIFYVLLILINMNFMAQGAFLCLILGIYCLFKFSKFKIDINVIAILLLIVGVCISVFIFGDSLNEIIKALNFLLIYFAGKNGTLYSRDKEKFIHFSIFCVFLGNLIQLMLDYIYNYGKTYEEGQRLIMSVWTHDYVSVTLVGLLSAAIIGYSYFGIFIGKNKLIKLISIGSIILTIVVNLSTATRTPIVLTAIVFMLMTIVYFIKIGSIKKMKLLFFIPLLFFISFLIFKNNCFGIKTYIESSNLSMRMKEAGLKTSRMDISKEYFKYMYLYYFGGSNIKKIVGIEAHNYLQQGYDMYGVLSFIGLIVITVHLWRNAICLLLKKNSNRIIFLLLSMFLALYIQCCLEPVFTAYPICFWTLLMIDGMMTTLNREFSVIK